MNIEKKLFPKSWKLIKKNGILTAQIIDEELDPFICHFNNDGCVEIHMDGNTYITLSSDALMSLHALIYDSKFIYHIRTNKKKKSLTNKKPQNGNRTNQ